MKQDIHPAYKDVQVTCSCGVTFVTKSTMHQRAFVLIPLSEIAPDLSLGPEGLVRDLAGAIDAAGVERLPD